MRPLFSLIIPACGCEPFLPKLFASLEAQTFRDFEVLFAVEGSQDHSLELCQKWCAEQQNANGIPAQAFGLPCTGAGGASRNHCYRQATGEYLLPLDGDDWFDDNALEILAKHVQRHHPDVLLGSAKIWLCDAAGNLTSTNEILTNLSREKDGEVMTGLELIRSVARSSGHFKNHGALVTVRREFLLGHELFQLEGTPSEDSEWTPRVILTAQSVVFVATPYYNYRRREGSVSSSRDARILHATAKIALRLAKFLMASNCPEDVKKSLGNDALAIFIWYLFNGLYTKRFSRKDRLEAIRSMCGTAEDAAAFRWLFSCASRSKRIGYPQIMLATKTGILFPATLYFRYLYYPLTRLFSSP